MQGPTIKLIVFKYFVDACTYEKEELCKFLIKYFIVHFEFKASISFIKSAFEQTRTALLLHNFMQLMQH